MPALSPRLVLMLTLPPLLWAGNAVVGRMTVPHVPPLLLNAIRWALVLLVLLVIGRRALAGARNRADIAARWPYLALVGLLGVGAYNALQYVALTTSTPINVTLIAASMPLWMLLIGALFFAERPQRGQMIGAALSLAGVAVVLGRGDPLALNGAGAALQRFDDTTMPATISTKAAAWYRCGASPSSAVDSSAANSGVRLTNRPAVVGPTAATARPHSP